MEFNPQIQLAGLLEWMAEQMNACHGKTAVIGISGGKDSSTVAAWPWPPMAAKTSSASSCPTASSRTSTTPGTGGAPGPAPHHHQHP